MRLLDQRRGLRVGGERLPDPPLARDLAFQHPVDVGTVARADRDRGRSAGPDAEFGETVAPVIEPPGMHRRQQPAIEMAGLVDVGRAFSGIGAARHRRGADPAGKARAPVEHRFAVELVPAVIVMADDIDHLFMRLAAFEIVIAEGAHELPAKRVVRAHRAEEMRLARRGGLDHHGAVPPGDTTETRLFKRKTRRLAPALRTGRPSIRSRRGLLRVRSSFPCPRPE